MNWYYSFRFEVLKSPMASFLLLLHNCDNTVEKKKNEDFEGGVYELHLRRCLLGQKRVNTFLTSINIL